MPSQVTMELRLSLPPEQGGSDNPWETVTPEEDKKKLRNATLTPARKKLSGGLHYMPSQVPMELPLSLPPGRLQVLTTPWRR